MDKGFLLFCILLQHETQQRQADADCLGRISLQMGPTAASRWGVDNCHRGPSRCFPKNRAIFASSPLRLPFPTYTQLQHAGIHRIARNKESILFAPSTDSSRSSWWDCSRRDVLLYLLFDHFNYTSGKKLILSLSHTHTRSLCYVEQIFFTSVNSKW